MKNDFIIENFSLSLSVSQKQKINHLTNFLKPYTQNIYIVGGFLRDQILGVSTDDIDLEVYDISQEIFHKAMEELGATVLSKDFFVYCYDGIDLSLPRKEVKTGEGYHGFKMEQTNNPKEALLRRDFTSNTLMYHLFEERLYDYYNGVDAIEKKILQVVNPKTFHEDNVRFLRAIRFMAKFGFFPEIETKMILEKMSLQDLTKTKIERELKKIFL